MLALSVLSTAFTLSGRFAHVDHHRGCAAMSSVKYTSNFEVTDALKAYADQKLGKPLETFGSLLNGDCELHLKVESRGLHVRFAFARLSPERAAAAPSRCCVQCALQSNR
jgi:hypothetical protein